MSGDRILSPPGDSNAISIKRVLTDGEKAADMADACKVG